MADYLIQEETLTNIANEIRELSGVEHEMSPLTMKNYLDIANEDANAQSELIESIKSALVGKSIPEGEQGVDTSDATAVAEDIMLNKTAYIADGKVTGSFTIDNELTEQNDLISQITTLVNQKANPSGGGNLETVNFNFTSIPEPGMKILYVDDTMELKQELIDKNTSCRVLKNTIFVILNFSETTIGNYSQIYGNFACRVFFAS